MKRQRSLPILFLSILVILAVASILIWFSSRRRSLLATDIHKLPDRAVLEYLDLPAEVASEAQATKTDVELDAVLRKYFRNRPDLRGLPRKSNLGAARKLLEEKLHLKPNPVVDMPFPWKWEWHKFGRNWNSQFHSLRYVQWLDAAYDKTGQSNYRHLAEKIVFDWIEKNPISKPPSRRSWHEGSTAHRLGTLMQFWQTYRKQETPTTGSIARLLLSIVQHIHFLTTPENYPPNGNHCIRQDIAVVIATIALPELRRGKEWQSFVLNRLVEKQIKACFTKEGVDKENSPGYHFYVLNQFQQLLMLIEKNKQPPLPGLRENIVQMEDFATHVLFPNGHIPPIGDSDDNPPTLNKLLKDYIQNKPNLLYAISAGRKGKPPPALDGKFSKSGYAIFRDTWGRPDLPANQATQVNFHAKYYLPNPLKHKHDDELSFILYGLGRNWIVDFGKYSYSKKDVFRKYAVSASAHNAYTYDDLKRRRLDLKSRLATMEPVFSKPTIAAARARNSCLKDAEIVRTLVFLRAQRTIILVDEIRSKKSHNWEGLLHLAPDLTPQVKGLRATCAAPERPWTLEVSADPAGATKLSVVSGQKDPIQGWNSPKWKQIVPSSTLIYSRPGKNWNAATIVRLKPKNGPPLENVSLKSAENTHTVTYRTGTTRHQVRISRDRPLTVKHTASKIVRKTPR